MKAEIVAYIAGIMDGEGSFLIEKFRTERSPIGFQYRSSVQLTMTDYEVMKFISDKCGRSMWTKTLKSGRTAYIMCWRNRFAVAFIEAIFPYLICKREQAAVLLDYERTIAPGRGRTYTQDAFARCEAARERLFALRRPVPPRC